jgi:hypothetical protein
MPKFTVLSRLEHDGKLYKPGAVIELEDDAAEPLAQAAVIEPAAADAEPTKAKKK